MFLKILTIGIVLNDNHAKTSNSYAVDLKNSCQINKIKDDPT